MSSATQHSRQEGSLASIPVLEVGTKGGLGDSLLPATHIDDDRAGKEYQ